MSDRTCDVCGTGFSFRWTDTHGIGVCSQCGTPYRIYHYENNERVDKPPAPALNERGMEIAREYWNERKAMVFPACYDFVPSYGETYSGATADQQRAFSDWYREKGYGT